MNVGRIQAGSVVRLRTDRRLGTVLQFATERLTKLYRLRGRAKFVMVVWNYPSLRTGVSSVVRWHAARDLVRVR